MSAKQKTRNPAEARALRAHLVQRAKDMKADIQQAFTDVDHWNRNNPHEEPIDPDPGGQLAQISAGCDRVIALEHEHGPLPSIYPFAKGPERPQ